MASRTRAGDQAGKTATLLGSELSRREVLKRAVGAGAAAPLLAGVAATWPAAVGMAQANLKNTVVFGLEGSPPTFDPAAATDSRVDTPSLNLYNALVQHKLGTTDIVPDLALSWQPAGDGLSYTFKLRPGVKFHDGTALTSADVAYTFERINGLKRGVYQNVNAVTAVETPDPTTVVLKLGAPFPALVQALTRVYIVNSALVKAHVKDNDYGEAWFTSNDAGSGPYTLASYEPEQQFTIKKFPDYWGGWDGAHVDGAIFRVIKEEASRRLALEQGEIDWALIGAVDTWQALKSNTALQTFSDPTLNQLYFALNQTHEQLQDVNVRRALSLVYDYQGHVQQARGGQAAVARGPLPPAIPFFDPSIPPSETNLDKAKAALKQSKWPDGGFSLEMIYQGTAPEETTAVQIMQAGAAQLNIEIKPVAMEWPAKVDNFSSKETAKAMGTIWIFPAYPDPHQFFYPLEDSENIGNGGVNFSYYSNPEVDALIKAGASEIDQTKRGDIYKQLQHKFVDDVPYMSIVVGYALSAARTWLQGYKWSPTHSFTQNVYAMSLSGKS